MNDFSIVENKTGTQFLVFGDTYNPIGECDFNGELITTFKKTPLDINEWILIATDKDSRWAWHGETQIVNGECFGKVIKRP
jgi:hypothetical protein